MYLTKIIQRTLCLYSYKELEACNFHHEYIPQLHHPITAIGICADKLLYKGLTTRKTKYNSEHYINICMTQDS